MIKQKILKLAKTLNIFTIDDLAILEEKEEAILLELKELIKEEIIYSNNGNYSLIAKRQTIIQKKSNQIKSFQFVKDAKIEKMPGYDEFVNVPEMDQKVVFKLIIILNACSGLIGNRLKRFLEKWNMENPKYKTSYSTVYFARRNFKEKGLMGLISNYRNNSRYFNSRWKDKKRKRHLIIRFAELYLSDKNLTKEECLIKTVKENFNDNYFEEIVLSEKELFIETVKKYYSEEEIQFFRKNKEEKLSINPELELLFDKAVEKYLKFIEPQKEKDKLRKLKTSIQNKLIPAFKNYRLYEINFEVINNFIKKEQTVISSKISINITIMHLRSVLKYFYPDYCDFKQIRINTENKNNPENKIKIKVLNYDEIKLLLIKIHEIDPDLYPITLTILTTGISIGEATALIWDDIDFSKKQIHINKILSNKKISYSTHLSHRIIDCPTCLLEVLKEYKTKQAIQSNIVFPNKKGGYSYSARLYCHKLAFITNLMGLKNFSFLSLRNTYISILIQRGMPLNHIQKLVGYSQIKSIVSIFEHLIPKKPLDEVFSFIE